MTIKDPYPHARVPEHLISLSIEKIPTDEPFYLSPGGDDDYEPPTIFVDNERRLKITMSAAIDIEDQFPQNPIGLVGIMKTYIISSSDRSLREAYIADLRFIEDHQLMDAGKDLISMNDQEEWSHWVSLMNDSIEIEGFIAPEQGADIDTDVPKGTLYGDIQLHDSLKFLRKKGKKIMKKYIASQSRSVVNSPKPENGSDGERKDKVSKENQIVSTKE